MRIAILCGRSGWHVQDLLRAARDAHHHAEAIDFRTLSTDFLDRPDNALLIRVMPAGSLEQVVFRMDLLHAAQREGRVVVNPPRAIETCVDKYLTDVRLSSAGLPTPKTHVAQQAEDALAAFDALGGDVVIKPLFGSEGRGMCRITDRDLAWRTFHTLANTGQVIYQQQFIHHPGWDYRVFVLGGQVLAGMRRSAAGNWRTNVAQGGRAEPLLITGALADLALAAADAVGATLAGVDLLPTSSGQTWVIEVNAVPGWRALSQTCRIDVAASIIRWMEGQTS